MKQKKRREATKYFKLVEPNHADISLNIVIYIREPATLCVMDVLMSDDSVSHIRSPII